tara:strand:+ start:67 stop:522 length:456 start_codon:yes stop_codon:yes gene_type:complete
MGCRISKQDPKEVHDSKHLKTYIPTLYDITVIKVYDGDTITICAKVYRFSRQYYKWSVRFRGIDTPEIKGKTKDEKDAAINARDALSSKILHKKILLKNIAYDKYGRLLADIYIGKTCLNTWMLENKYAIEYDGGTKVIPKSWKEFQENRI